MKFLSRARKFLQGLGSEPESKVQYFNVMCASGHRVRGERTEGYQALRCPACGDGVFVLPRSPLPQPVGAARPQSAREAGGGGGWPQEGPVELTDASRVSVEVVEDEAATNGAEIIWEDVADEYITQPGSSGMHRGPAAGEDEIDQSPGPVEKSAGGAPGARSPDTAAHAQSQPKKVDKRGEPRGRDQSEAEAATARDREPRSAREAGQAGRRVRARSPRQVAVPVIEPRRGSRRRALHALIFLVVPLVVVVTVGWRIRQHSRQEYPLIAEEGRLKGIPALDEGNFDKAYQLLSSAKAAVDYLGGAVEDAEAICSAADQAEVFVKLSNRSLEELLTEAGRTSRDDWQTRFDALYKGQYVIFDTHISAQPTPGKYPAYEVEYVVFPLGESTSFRRTDLAKPELFGRIDLSEFQLFELAHPQVGDRVTFGAKLAAFKYDVDNDRWLIRLEPRSGVYITHTKALESLGWPSIAEPDSQLEGQP